MALVALHTAVSGARYTAVLVVQHTAASVTLYIALAAPHAAVTAQCIVFAVQHIAVIVAVALRVAVASRYVVVEIQHIVAVRPCMVVVTRPPAETYLLTDGTCRRIGEIDPLTGEAYLSTGETGLLTGEACLSTGEAYPLTGAICPLTDVGYLQVEGVEHQCRQVRLDVCPFGDPSLEPMGYLDRDASQSWKALAMKRDMPDSMSWRIVRLSSSRPRRLVKKSLRRPCKS